MVSEPMIATGRAAAAYLSELVSSAFTGSSNVDTCVHSSLKSITILAAEIKEGLLTVTAVKCIQLS